MAHGSLKIATQKTVSLWRFNHRFRICLRRWLSIHQKRLASIKITIKKTTGCPVVFFYLLAITILLNVVVVLLEYNPQNPFAAPLNADKVIVPVTFAYTNVNLVFSLVTLRWIERFGMSSSRSNLSRFHLSFQYSQLI